jgi:hypothetical protein
MRVPNKEREIERDTSTFSLEEDLALLMEDVAGWERDLATATRLMEMISERM